MLFTGKKKVVVKQMKVDRSTSESQRHHMERLFVKEAKMLHTFNHRNIVEFIGVCEMPKAHILECIEFDFGKEIDSSSSDMIRHNLHEVLKFLTDWHAFELYERNFNLPIKALTDVAYGLDFLHSCQVAHRDLKALNVLASNKSGLIFKLTDFGEARSELLQTQSLMHAAATVSGNDRGTLVYNGPEIHMETKILGLEDLIKHDIWTYGLLIFQVYNGDLSYPWYQEIHRVSEGMGQARAVIKRCMKKGLLPKPSGKYHMPDFVSKIYKRCVRYDPNERPTMTRVKQMLYDYPSPQASNTKAATKTGIDSTMADAGIPMITVPTEDHIWRGHSKTTERKLLPGFPGYTPPNTTARR